MNISKCLYCNGQHLKKIATRRDGVSVLKCLDCGLIMRADIPENIDDVYNDNYYQKGEDANQDELEEGYNNYYKLSYFDYYFIWKYNFVNLVTQNKQPGKILDIGCANGEFLNLMSHSGWETLGIEISEEGAAETEKKGIRVLNSDITKVNIKEKFDVIVAWDVLEHVQDIKAFIGVVTRMLKTDGVFIFATTEDATGKKNNWLNYNSSLEHIIYPTKNFLQKLFAKTSGNYSSVFNIEYDGYSPLLGYIRNGKANNLDAQIAQYFSNQEMKTAKLQGADRARLLFLISQYRYPEVAEQYYALAGKNNNDQELLLLGYIMSRNFGDLTRAAYYLKGLLKIDSLTDFAKDIIVKTFEKRDVSDLESDALLSASFGAGVTGDLYKEKLSQFYFGLTRVREKILVHRIEDIKTDLGKCREMEEFLRYELNKRNRIIAKTGANKVYRVLTTLKHPGSVKEYFSERRKYKDYNAKVAENISKQEKLLEPTKEVLEKISHNEKFVTIISNTFLYKDGSKPFLGGAERYLLDLSKIIAKLGYKTRIYQLSSKKFWYKKYDNTVEVIGVPTEDSKVLSDFATGHTPNENLVIFSPFSLAFSPRKKSIGISHGVYWDSEHAQEDRGQYNEFYAKIIESMSNCDALVSVDTNTINSVRATHNSIASKFEYIPNYVDTDVFRPAKRKDDRIRIIYPRRLYWPRGFYLLVNVLDRVLSIDPRVEVVFVGQADPKEEEITSDLVARFGDRIKWESYSPDKMSKAYQKADIALVPTLASEGTSLSCLEAMACGNAVIATNVGGLPDLILDGFNGLLISPNGDDLTEAIQKIVTDGELREHLSANAINVAKNFNIKKWDKEWERILKGFLE